MELISHIDYKALYEEQKSENASLRQEVMKMQLYVRKLSQIVFGSKSERFIPNAAQLALGMNKDFRHAEEAKSGRGTWRLPERSSPCL
jgi:hypothetical protein